MAYQSTKPQPNDPLSQSQGDILGNFTAIKTLVDINHETFDIANEGKHLKVDLTNQTASHPITSAANEVTLYSNAGALNISHNGGTPVDVTTTTYAANKGHTYLPSGLIMNFGNFTLGSGSLSSAITISQPITTQYNVTYSAYNNNADFTKELTLTYVTAGAPITTYTFTRGRTGASVTFHYLILGI